MKRSWCFELNQKKILIVHLFKKYIIGFNNTTFYMVCQVWYSVRFVNYLNDYFYKYNILQSIYNSIEIFHLFPCKGNVHITIHTKETWMKKTATGIVETVQQFNSDHPCLLCVSITSISKQINCICVCGLFK